MSDALKIEATELRYNEYDYEKLIKDVDGLLKEVEAKQSKNDTEYVATLRYNQDQC